jgi:hypothetical protein
MLPTSTRTKKKTRMFYVPVLSGLVLSCVFAFIGWLARNGKIKGRQPEGYVLPGQAMIGRSGLSGVDGTITL